MKTVELWVSTFQPSRRNRRRRAMVFFHQRLPSADADPIYETRNCLSNNALRR